jgi:hypothetical protein
MPSTKLHHPCQVPEGIRPSLDPHIVHWHPSTGCVQRFPIPPAPPGDPCTSHSCPPLNNTPVPPPPFPRHIHTHIHCHPQQQLQPNTVAALRAAVPGLTEADVGAMMAAPYRSFNPDNLQVREQGARGGGGGGGGGRERWEGEGKRGESRGAGWEGEQLVPC